MRTGSRYGTKNSPRHAFLAAILALSSRAKNSEMTFTAIVPVMAYVKVNLYDCQMISSENNAS